MKPMLPPRWLVWFFFGLIPVSAEELKLPEDFTPDPKRPWRTELVSAETWYREGEERLQQEFRIRFAKVLAKADHAELLLLKFDTTEEEKKGDGSTLLSLGSGSSSSVRILQTKVLEPGTLKEFLPLLAATVATPDTGSPMCHYPIHGIRLRAGDQLLFETSLCWMCGNYPFTYPDGSSAYVGFESKALQTFINRQLPIPKEESSRFARTVTPTHPIDPTRTEAEKQPPTKPDHPKGKE